jgi:hypothetical protein
MRPIPVTWTMNGRKDSDTGEIARIIHHGLIVGFTEDNSVTYAVVMSEGQFRDVSIDSLEFDEPEPVEKGETHKIEFYVTSEEQAMFGTRRAAEIANTALLAAEKLDYWHGGRAIPE